MLADKVPLISGVHFEQSPERLKVVLPLKRNWPFLAIYTLMVVVWLIMLVWGVIFILRIAFSGERYALVFSLILFVFLVILFRFGKFLFRQWATYLSNREILFINREELIVRRPVSIWGNTDAYDMQHVTPFYLSEKPAALAFDYGYRHIYIGEALSAEARESLRHYLNTAYFPNHDEGEDE